MRTVFIVIRIFVYTGLFFIGITIGNSIKVFVVRGVPIIHGGGELLVLLGLPVSFGIGYLTGHRKVTEAKSIDNT